MSSGLQLTAPPMVFHKVLTSTSNIVIHSSALLCIMYRLFHTTETWLSSTNNEWMWDKLSPASRQAADNWTKGQVLSGVLSNAFLLNYWPMNWFAFSLARELCLRVILYLTDAKRAVINKTLGSWRCPLSLTCPEFPSLEHKEFNDKPLWLHQIRVIRCRVTVRRLEINQCRHVTCPWQDSSISKENESQCFPTKLHFTLISWRGACVYQMAGRSKLHV